MSQKIVGVVLIILAVAGAISIIGFINEPRWKWVVGGLVVILGAVAAVLFMFPCFGRSVPPLEIVIDHPGDGRVTCDEVAQGHCRVLVSGTVSSMTGTLDLTDDMKLYVVVQANPNDVFWIGGNAVSAAEMRTGRWKVEGVGLGKVTEEFRRVTVQAIITTERYSSGQHLSEIPCDAARSQARILSW